MKQGHLFQSQPVAHSRHTDPVTSKLAAQSISSDKIRASQQEILDILRDYGPLSDNAIYKHVKKQSVSGARTRRSELVRLNLVQDSRQRERTISDRLSIVWELVHGDNKERIYGPGAVC